MSENRSTPLDSNQINEIIIIRTKEVEKRIRMIANDYNLPVPINKLKTIMRKRFKRKDFKINPTHVNQAGLNSNKNIIIIKPPERDKDENFYRKFSFSSSFTLKTASTKSSFEDDDDDENENEKEQEQEEDNDYDFEAIDETGNIDEESFKKRENSTEEFVKNTSENNELNNLTQESNKDSIKSYFDLSAIRNEEADARRSSSINKTLEETVCSRNENENIKTYDKEQVRFCN